MKKSLTLLFTLLMAFVLVGCNSKENESIEVDKPEQQEVVEVVKDDKPEIVGGFVDADDPTITDELKDIFDEGLSALLGAKYEPVKLLATQVVNGINYKFLATGTKTTNPITVGTYNVVINKASDGSISLVDIELVEEKQKEVIEKDYTDVDFWVVFYDQYGNEMQRTAEKYGTVPEYKTWLPEGFDKWVYEKTGEDVTTFKPITTNTYFKAVCHEVCHSSGNVTPIVTNYTVKFQLEENLDVEVGEVQNSDGQKVTTITVPSQTTISVNENKITIDGSEFTAVANNGWTFSGFAIDDNRITADITVTNDITINVLFAQDQPE